MRKLSDELKLRGFDVSYRLVGEILNEEGFSLQANRKTDEGKSHPDRNAQFEHIHQKVIKYQAQNQPVISVDAKKKELVGNFKNAGRDDLKEIINKGEGYDLEFKSTLRWDLKLGKTSQHVERASLKTIAAFLNSNGGILLIGVRDDGSAEGIESDRFPNTDKFLLHLWTLVRTSFGTDISPYIQTKLEPVQGKTICKIKCVRASRPVFLRQPGFEEEFYVRVGPGTVSLAVSEALKYIADHFPDRQKI